MPFCVHCTKPAGTQRCSCCPLTHYCSTECQKADWHTIHRYERHFYTNAKLGAVDGETLPDEKREQRQEEVHKKVHAMTADRLEYQDLIKRTQEVMEKTPMTRKRRGLTIKQRKAMDAQIRDALESPQHFREKNQRQFTDTLEKLIEEVGVMPYIENDDDEKVRKLEIDETKEAQISLLFRQYDLLHAKRTYALATGQLEDSEEAALYRLFVEEEEARFIHGFLFGDHLVDSDGPFSYNAIHRERKSRMRQQLAGQYSDYITDQVVKQVAQLCAEQYNDATPKDNLKGFSGNEDKGTTDDNGAGGDGEGKKTLSMAMSVVNALCGTNDVKLDKLQEAGSMSKERCENTKSFVRGVWDNCSTKLSGFVENSDEFVDRVKAYLDEEYGINMKLPVRVLGITLNAIVIFLFVYYVMALIAGWVITENPYTPEMAAATDSLNGAYISNQNLQTSYIKIDDAVQDLTNVANFFRTAIYSASNSESFLVRNLSEADMTRLDNRLQVNATISGYMEYLRRLGSVTTNKDTLGVINIYLNRGAEILGSTTAEEYYNNVSTMAEVIRDNEGMMSNVTGRAGAIALETARGILDALDTIIRATGENLQTMGKELYDQRQNAVAGGRAVAKMTTTLVNNAIKAPLFYSSVKWLSESLDLSMKHLPLAVVEFTAKTLVYGVAGLTPKAGIEHVTKAEILFRQMALDSGFWETSHDRFSWRGLSALTYLVAGTWNSVTFLMHAVVCLSLTNFRIRQYLGSCVMAINRRLANRFGGLVFGQVDDADYQAMKEMAAEITHQNSFPEQADALQKAWTDFLGDKKMTVTQYAILVELIMKNENKLTNAHVFMHATSLTYQVIDTFLSAIGCYVIYLQIVELGEKLVQCAYWIYALLCAFNASPLNLGTSIAIVAVYLIGAYYRLISLERDRKKGKTQIGKGGVAWRAAFWPAYSFCNVAIRHPNYTIVAVTFIHSLMSYTSGFFSKNLEGVLEPYPKNLVQYVYPSAENQLASLKEYEKFVDSNMKAIPEIGAPMSTLEKYYETVKSYGISLKQFSANVARVTNAPMPELAAINVKIDDVVELGSKL